MKVARTKTNSRWSWLFSLLPLFLATTALQKVTGLITTTKTTTSWYHHHQQAFTKSSTISSTIFFQPSTTLASSWDGIRARSTQLSAKAKKKKKNVKSNGGGFGSSSSSASATDGKSSNSSGGSTPTISADKNSLEKQWDIFASITDLEITPKGDPDDENYVDFEVADVFVRCGAKNNNDNNNKPVTKWFRIGKVCTSDKEGTPMDAVLTLQKGLIFWTAVHMRRELVAAGGKSGAASLELGFQMPATLTMGSESDGPIVDEEEEREICIAERGTSSLKGIKGKTLGFRPDWNPPGFTYKRREKDAMKKKVSKLEEMKVSATE